MRCEYHIPWAINPFIHNPYSKHAGHHSHEGTPGSVTPAHDADKPQLSDMMTIQQMHSLNRQQLRQERRASVKPHMMSMAETLAQPKASYAELFYDLFFVASLTSFGIKHEITQDQAIASYVAFFTVLWYSLLHARVLI
jgi:hypothetical protein